MARKFTGLKDLISEPTFQPKTFDEAYEHISRECLQQLRKKGQDYGKDNINFFGIRGVIVRLGDKIMRLRQHYFQGHEFHFESVMDNLKDAVTYGILGIMKESKNSDGTDWYNLPFRETE